MTVPSLLAHRLTGYVPRIYRYPYVGVPPMMHQSASRTTFYDEVVDRHIRGIDQLVILGAGFDTRACRVPADARVRCFEIDDAQDPGVQARDAEEGGLGHDAGHIRAGRFPEGGLVREARRRRLRAGQAELFTWESVTMYLDQEAVESTLRKIAG